MSTVIIEKPETASEMSVLTDEAHTIDGRIRERAFELFEKSGEARGNDSENWFQAEEELLQVPRPTISAQDGSIFLQMTILGYHEEQLKVIAMQDALIVSAEPKHRHSRNHLAAIGAKRIFQRFDLPDSIDTSSVHATFENGLLKIAAKLASPKRECISHHVIMPFFYSYSSFQVLGLPWPLLALALVLCLMLSALGFKAVEYFVSLGYAASIAGQAIVFAILYWNTMGGAARFQSALLLAYGLRLGLFIAHRERLPGFRKQQAENADRGARVVGGWLKVGIWLGVSLFYVLLFLPALLTMSAQNDLSLVPLPAGLVLMTAGLALEASADWQKSRFKKQNPSRFCDVGLYRVVRFPNYLGEMVFWCGLWVSAWPAYRTLPVWVAGSLGFLLIALVMMGASRRLEVKQGKRYGSDTTFGAYSRRVPILFPFVPIYSLQSQKLART